MSENKTAADAPQMAHRAIMEAYGGHQGQDEPDWDHVVNVYGNAIDAIAALPPAPLPPDVVALVRRSRELDKQRDEVDGIVNGQGDITPVPFGVLDGYFKARDSVARDLAALPLPEDGANTEGE